MAGIRARGAGQMWSDHEVEDKPLTLICHKGDVQVEVPDAIEIDYDVTRYHGKRVVNIDAIALAWIEFIMGYELEPHLKPEDRHNSLAHVIGLCDLPIKLMQKAKSGLPLFIREPETSLHPSQVVRATEFLVSMTNNVQDDGSFHVLPTEDQR
jgi:hypothetical protein